MRSGQRLLGLTAVALSILSCVESGVRPSLPPVEAPLESSIGLRAEDRATQRIMRVRFEGRPASVGFRMVLRLVSETRYQISAADAFGRLVWSLDYQAPASHYVDFRNGMECRTTQPTTAVEIAFETLSLAELPAILLGRLPGGLRQTDPLEIGSRDFVDNAGRKWTASLAGVDLANWTLWEDGEPLLWFQKLPAGGVLSHRRGVQLRWRESKVETMTSEPAPISAPRGVVTIPCEEIARRYRLAGGSGAP